ERVGIVLCRNHEADKRSFDVHPRHRGRRAKPDLPAERLLACRDAGAASAELLFHAARDARIVPGVCHSCPPSYPEASIEPAPIQPHTSTTSCSDVLLKPCQQPRGE